MVGPAPRPVTRPLRGTQQRRLTITIASDTTGTTRAVATWRDDTRQQGPAGSVPVLGLQWDLPISSPEDCMVALEQIVAALQRRLYPPRTPA